MVTKILFTVSFPAKRRRTHIHPLQLRSLVRQQLTDSEIIDTIDHLFGCPHCFEQYRYIRTAHLASR